MGAQVTVTAKGQVTIRKEYLEHLGAEPGVRLNVEKLPDGRLELRPAPTEDIDSFIGCLRSPRPKAPTIDEMNDLIAAGWSGEK